LTLDPPSPAFSFLTRVALSYATLLDTPLAHPETGLGGRLFYAAELDEEGRALLVAANIAGAVTLAASANRDAQKQALRDGVADFVVTNLDEALRILKNQLRKRETVAVCVAQSPSEVEREMNQRGVAPDLLRSGLSIPPSHDALAHQNKTNTPIAQQSALTEPDPATTPALVTWRVDSALPKDLALLDEIALACLDPRLDANAWKSRRWLRLSPRFLGRLAQNLRMFDSNREFAARFWERVSGFTERNEIAFAFEIASYYRGTHDIYRFAPTQR
jgi:Urocanase Rossmann-like domain